MTLLKKKKTNSLNIQIETVNYIVFKQVEVLILD